MVAGIYEQHVALETQEARLVVASGVERRIDFWPDTRGQSRWQRNPIYRSSN